jgi:hypothetical protein
MQLLLALTQSIIFACSYWYVACFWLLLNSTSYLSAIYLSLELAFYIHQEFEIRRMVDTEFPDASSSLDQNERQTLLEEFISFFRDGTFTGWFMWKNSRMRLNRDELCHIQRENLVEWILWAFFGLDNSNSIDTRVSIEVDSMLQRFEDVLGTSFGPGYNDSIR